jgi:SAM-dependent methyltransferase
MEHDVTDRNEARAAAIAAFDGPLEPLANGVLTPGFQDQEVSRFIHGQFASEAGAKDYAARYPQRKYFAAKLKRAFERLEPPSRPAPLILDIGSGSGNTVFPMLELIPGSRVVATDLSVQLLGILLQASGDGRVAAVQENAELLRFKAATFDYVVGGAVLHHLFRPELALARAAQILRPGGAAIFFEPCENGQLLTRIAYERILLDPRSSELDARLRQAIEHQIGFIGVRVKRRPSEHPAFYADKEDKWLFPRSFFEDAAAGCGFARALVEPLDPGPRPISAKVTSQFRLLRLDAPQWVLKVVEEFEGSLSKEFVFQNPAGVAVVLGK